MYSSAWIGSEGTRSVAKAGSDDDDSPRARRRRRRRNRGGGATVRVIQDAAGYGIGDTIDNTDAEIVSIEQGQVTLKRANGQLEVLTMATEEGATKTVSASSKGDDEEEDGVEKLANDHFTIEREVIDKLAADPSQLAKLGRAVPHKGPDGDVDGYRLSGIRRNSLGRKLGLRSGDVVHSINGYDMTSMSAAMEAWNSLQGANALQVDVTRRGSKRNIKVDVE
jgi:general secretion pathway protein C